MRGALVFVVCMACSASATRTVRSDSPTPAASHEPAAPLAHASHDPAAPLANIAPAPVGADSDGDGILDGTDRCPDVAEDWDAFADTDGCLDADDDGDGIVDADDACPDEKGPSIGVAERVRGCPDRVCKTWVVDGIDDCFLSSIAEPGMANPDDALRKLVAEVSTFPEIQEVTIRAFRLPTETKEAGLARLEPIRARLIALGWPARISLVLTTRTSSDPESTGLVNGEVSKQRFEYDKNFRPGTCTMLGDVYRPERPDATCRLRSP